MQRRVAVFGDVGGHAQELARALSYLGVNLATGDMPDGLTIVQCGDLVHKGPDSPGVVRLVDGLMVRNPGRWVQVVGNHDAQLLSGATDFWDETLPWETTDTVRRWWDDGLLHVGAAFVTAGVPVRRKGGIREHAGAGPLLVTHAGLTSGAWNLLGRPSTAVDTVAALDSRKTDRSSVVWREGIMMTGASDMAAGPLWAAASSELYPSWASPPQGEHVVPRFAQAHGHTSPYVWNSAGRSNPWRYPVPDLRRHSGLEMTVDETNRIVRAEISDHVMWAVDPCHGESPAASWGPLVLNLA